MWIYDKWCDKKIKIYIEEEDKYQCKKEILYFIVFLFKLLDSNSYRYFHWKKTCCFLWRHKPAMAEADRVDKYLISIMQTMGYTANGRSSSN